MYQQPSNSFPPPQQPQQQYYQQQNYQPPSYQQPVYQYQQPTYQPPKKKKTSLTTKIIIGVTVFLFLMIVASSERDSDSNVSTDKTTSESQIDETSSTTEKEIDTNIQTLMDATEYSEDVCKKIFSQLKECGYTKIGTLTEVSTGTTTKSFKVTGEFFGSGMIIVEESGLYFFSWGSDTLYDSENSDIIKNINDYAIGTWDKTKYFSAAENAIENMLKAPSTAEFPSQVWSDAWKISVSNGVVNVSSYVDAQNSFGAMVRSYFTVQYRISDGEGIYLEFDEKVYLDER